MIGVVLLSFLFVGVVRPLVIEPALWIGGRHGFGWFVGWLFGASIVLGVLLNWAAGNFSS